MSVEIDWRRTARQGRIESEQNKGGAKTLGDGGSDLAGLWARVAMLEAKWYAREEKEKKIKEMRKKHAFEQSDEDYRIEHTSVTA